ncbi:MAG: tetraacyldisaccharide 4'-kinase [Planctomycetota bacterium]|nr:tetraacyldisaccharide 4'-kinase [Planctomycetota bacterium]
MNNPFSHPLERIFAAASGSGRPTGGWALVGAWLDCISALYRRYVQAKNAAYGIGLFRQVRLPWPTISVGNLTLGGTGKTPMVMWLAGYLAESGTSVVVLSRGYGRVDSRPSAGTSDSLARGTAAKDDEAFGVDVTHRFAGGAARSAQELADEIRVELEGQKDGRAGRAMFELRSHRGLASGARVLRVACPERARVASAMAPVLDRLGGKWVFLLDDGLQHRRLARDLDVVMVSFLEPLAGARLFPAGAFREPPSSLHRAQVVVLTHVDTVGGGTARRQREAVRRLAPDAAVVEGSHRISSVRVFPATRAQNVASPGPAAPGGAPLSGRVGPEAENRDADWLKGKRMLAFCGIGKPAQFVSSLTSAGGVVVASVPFPDHHAYESRDISAIVARATKNEVDLLATTEKDVNRLGEYRFPFPLAVVAVDLEFTSGVEGLKAEISRALGRPPAGAPLLI